MNILASYDWLKEHLKKPPHVDEFVRRMTEVGNSVEHIYDLGAQFDKMVVGKILEVKPHPNADKLRIAVTDVGKTVEIVCGGSNLAVDQLVAVALPGAKVKWHGEGELVEIKEAELRGVKSYGMICAAAEIGFEKLKQAEREIWDLTNLVEVKPGTPLAEALDLQDHVFDIEVTTNRPDAMSIVGLAREAGAAEVGVFTWKAPALPKGGSSKLNVSVDATDLCLRYQAVIIDNVKVGPSPWWLQKRLLLSGHRPINNVVDITNYILHELGQPLHAFDADKLEGGKIVVRKAKNEETILALDGNEYHLDLSMLVIADAKRPVAVAGVMGGEPTGTMESTTRLVIESATFDSVSVRRTARALNLYSDSSSLFEKGLSTESTTPALARAIELICELTGGHVASNIVDERAGKYQPMTFPYDPDRVSGLIGVEIPVKQQTKILQNLGFEVGKNKITVPYWRDHDIESSVDFTEEVVRMFGYAKVPAQLPTGAPPIRPQDALLTAERTSKEALAGAGCTEIYNYSFISIDELGKLDIALSRALKIANPLSEEWTYMRPTLLPSVLRTVEENQHRHGAAQLFELAAIHQPPIGKDLPLEQKQLMVAVYESDGAKAFRRAKGILEAYLHDMGVTEWNVVASSSQTYFHPGRTGEVSARGVRIGTIGELHPDYAKRWGIDVRLVLIDLDLDALTPLISSHKTYVPLPEYQDVIRDVSFVLPERSTYAELHAAIAAVNALIQDVALLDVYQGKGIDPGKKSMAFRLHLRADDRTLSSEEGDVVMQAVTKMLEKSFGATIR